MNEPDSQKKINNLQCNLYNKNILPRRFVTNLGFHRCYIYCLKSDATLIINLKTDISSLKWIIMNNLYTVPRSSI